LDRKIMLSNMRVQVYQNGNYKTALDLGKERIIGGTR